MRILNAYVVPRNINLQAIIVSTLTLIALHNKAQMNFHRNVQSSSVTYCQLRSRSNRMKLLCMEVLPKPTSLSCIKFL